MSNELVVSNSSFLPVMHVETAVQRFSQLAQFVGQIMKDGKDYGVIPGTGDKPTLYKPGAEKLTTFFGLSPEFILVEKETDWTGKEHDGEPFFYFHYRCRMLRDDRLIGEGLGSCNSWETKYRFRNASKVCPNCGKETIIKGKAEYGGGWLCFGKKGGCGAKFRDGDTEIENQPSGKVKHDNPADIVNTIDKMAQKRALVAATLIAVNASEFFTQDIEDYVVDAPIIDITPPPAPPTMSEPVQVTPPPANGKPQHPPRPMEPEKTRQFIASLVTYKRSKNADGTQILTDPDAPASQAARGLFVGKLTEVFAPNDDADKMRRSVIGYLFGVASSTELTKAQVSAGLDWLIDHKTDDGDYIINAFAIDEARAIERQVLLDAGQQEMQL